MLSAIDYPAAGGIRARSLMDKMPASEAGDYRFDSCRAHCVNFPSLRGKVLIYRRSSIFLGKHKFKNTNSNVKFDKLINTCQSGVKLKELLFADRFSWFPERLDL